MGEKKRVNIYVDITEWEKLSRNIDCSKSEWINQQIRKQNRCVDKVDELDLRIKSIENQEKTLALDKLGLIEMKNRILEQRKKNSEEFEVVNHAMDTIRRVNSNPDRKLDYIEDERVKHIASENTLNPDVLFEQMEKEGIKHKDVPIPKEDLKGYGKYG